MQTSVERHHDALPARGLQVQPPMLRTPCLMHQTFVDQTTQARA